MRRFWLASQMIIALGVFVWVATGMGCGAKSQLLVDEEEEEETIDPSVDPREEPPVDCERDADCSDGEYCNGIELCEEGFCEDGAPVDCGDGDECHMAYCDEERDQCVEMLIAEDVDGDGYFGRPCGEDCDDANPEVHPGAEELCNGLDDDCDGLIDENLVEACDDFGRRLCVDGEWTECLLCTVCIPGAVRYCDTIAYCSWGEQRCNDRGDGWSECYETSPPAGCSGYSYDQDCCMRSGNCCQDWIDSDGDWDSNDSVGACEDVTCPGAR